MGVPTQRLSHKPKNSAGLRPGPAPIATTKLRTSKTKLSMSSRAHSDTAAGSVTVRITEAVESSRSSKLAKPGPSKAIKGTDNGGTVDKSSRKIATNSRIKKNEQTKRDMYLAFVNNALKAKSEVSAPVAFSC
jgi:hypothetical protein